jgi:hemerythrin-like domain-containing protein
MCNYCGCLEFPLVRQLTDEHEAIQDAAGRLRPLVLQGRYAEARQRLADLVGLLVSHTAAEEGSLFAELRNEGTLAAEVEQLCAQHKDIHSALGPADDASLDWTAVLPALDLLRQHIDDEEYDLFPAAVLTLPIPVWDRITPLPAA